jgi:hypothetical protein
MNANTTRLLTLFACFLVVLFGVGIYANANNTFGIGERNDTANNTTNDNNSVLTPVDNSTPPVIPVLDPIANGTGTGNQATNNTPVINNNNYININNNINVPSAVQPTIVPTLTETDAKLKAAAPVVKQTVAAPVIVKQTTVTIKTSDLYTGQIVKVSNAVEEKTGLEITEVNTGLKGCEYVVIKNNNDFDMGMGGYTLFIYETNTAIKLPNIEIAAGKSVKMFTVNGKVDTFDKDGDLQKFHFRLAQELYPDKTKVNIYLMEPNFDKAISQIETVA